MAMFEKTQTKLLLDSSTPGNGSPTAVVGHHPAWEDLASSTPVQVRLHVHWLRPRALEVGHKCKIPQNWAVHQGGLD